MLNEEFVIVFNVYVENFNKENVVEIEVGIVEVLMLFSVEFIEKVFGIKLRYVVNKVGIIDLEIMSFCFFEWLNDEILILVEMVVVVLNDVFV